MKILFLYPNSGSQVGFNYGVAHLAGVLKNKGHKISFWQLCEELAPLPAQDQFCRRLRTEAPDLLAFSVVTNQWAYARRLAEWARHVFPGPLVCGGIHTLFNTDQILDTGLFDYVFRGECEDAFAEFVTRLEQNQNVDGLPNLAFRRAGRTRINPVRPLPDLQTLPPKDYSIMDFQTLIDAKKGWVGLMASRGCPFACTYCFNHQMVDVYRRDLGCSFRQLHYIRHFPVEQVIGEIRFLLESYRRINMFIFDDDLFTFDKTWVRQFAAAYRRLTSLPFVVNAHVGFFDAELAALLAIAGCRVVKFGVESGSPELRRRILHRHMTNERIIEAVTQVNTASMHSSVFIIIGFPHETPDHLMETIRLLALARPGRFRWTYFFPYPGTRAHQMSIEGGFVNQAKMDRLVNFTDESCLDFGPQQNLLLKKIGRIMPWFVNAYSDLPVAPEYRRRVDNLLALEDHQWEKIAPTLHAEDKLLSSRFAARGLTHYAIKYNPFMGVISDYFLNEK